MKKYTTSTKNRLTIRLQTILLFVSFVIFIQVCSAQLPIPEVNNVVLTCGNDNFNITGIPGLGGNDIIWSDDYLNQTQLFQGLNYSSTTSSSFMLYAFSTDGAATSPDPKQTYIFRPQSATGIITESPDLCGNINLSFAIDSIIDSLTLIVSEDATIDPTDGATNFNNNFLNIRSEIYETGVHFLLKYDLSTIPLGVHPFYSHSAAMAYSGYAHGNNGNVYEQHVLDDSWDENTVTNNNAPLPLAPNSTADVAGNWWIWYGNPSYSVAHGNSATMGVSDEGNKAGINSNPLLNDLVNLEYMGDQTMSLYHFSPGYDTRYYSKDFKTDVALLPQLKVMFSYNLDTDCTYSWTGPGGFTASTKDITDLSVSGLYTLQITNQYGCISSYDYNAVINSISEDPSFTSLDFCETQGNVISGIATPGGTFSIVSQSGSNAVIIDPLTGLLSNHSAGDQITIQYNTSLSACQDSSVQTVNVFLASTAPLFDAITPICSGEVLNPLPLISTNGVNGTWDPALDNTTTTIYTFTPNIGECANNTTLTITVNPSTTPIFDPVADICSGGALNPLPLISNNGINGTWSPALDNTTTTTYTFSPDSGQCATTTTLTITVTASINPIFDPISSICVGDLLTPLPLISNNGVNGTWSPALDNTTTTIYTFTPDAGQCASATTSTITVNSLISSTFDPIAAICEGDALTLPTLSTNTITGAWSPAFDNTTTTNYTFNPDAGQCASTASMTITVNTSTVPTFTGVADICEGAVLSSLPLNSSNAILGTWSPAINNTTTTLYTFTPNSGQCSQTTTMTIVVNPIDDAAFNYSSAAFCVDDSNPIPTISGVIGGVFSIDGTGAINPTSGEIDILQSGAGNFSITYSTNGLCPSSFNFDLTLSDIADASINPYGPFCSADNSIILVGADQGGAWSGPGVDPITGEFNPALANIGNNTIVYTISGACGDSQSIQIEVIESPVVTAGADETIIFGNTANLTSAGTFGTYQWSPITGVDCPICQNSTASPEITTTYLITQENNGCFDSDQMIITVEYDPFVFIPNIFSPNNDNQNDALFVRGTGISTIEFLVFDRWGEKVFETNSLEIGWDGTFRGQDMSPGVFMYVASVTFTNGSSSVVKGDVTLVR